MFTKEDIESVLTVINTSIGNYETQEADGYNKGSYFVPKYYNKGITYLDIYQFILTQVYNLLDDNLDYNDYGYNDESIVYVIEKSNELIYYYI